MLEYRFMESRRQWGALTTGGHVAPTEVRHGGDTCALSQGAGVTDLECKWVLKLWTMAQGLAMAANGLDIVCADTTFSQQ